MMYQKYSKGIIEVITGPMFSGKSEELIKRIKLLIHAKTKTLVIKPSVDTRWNEKKILSRAGVSIDTVSLKKSNSIWREFKKQDYKAIAIDEAHFFDEQILDVVNKLANKGVKVIISGLDQDYTGTPFGIMPKLLAVADLVDKKAAVCSVCHNAATKTYRKIKNKGIVFIGTKEYEPRCRKCHFN